MEQTFKLKVEYDGTMFSGWQRQPGRLTIQGELESVLSLILNQAIQIHGSGRTDAGVHALGQVAHFTAQTPLDALEVKKGVNSLIRYPIVILDCTRVAGTFHSQYQARSKEYHYFILNRPDPCAIGAAYVWQVKKPLDLEQMNQCCECIIGVHDFKSYENTGSPRTSTVRQVFFARIDPLEDNRLVFKISATGFLKNMVRNIMGTLVDAGLGKMDAQRFEEILRARDRSFASATAPARGLFLMQVNYA